MMSGDEQRRVYKAVEARGYTAGWNNHEFIARQMAKLAEELGEVTWYYASKDGDEVRELISLIRVTARVAGRLFDRPEPWHDAFIWKPSNMRSEVADMQVILFALAEAITRETGEPFDVAAAAVEKATSDIHRGVR